MSSVASYGSPVEAEMICDFLKSNGLNAAIADSTGMNALGGANPMSNLVLLVDREQVAEARKLLAGYAAQSADGNQSIDVAPAERFDGYFETDWNDRERAVESAYRAAIVGWFVPFVSWYALWQLLRVFTLNQPLNARSARRAWIAAAVMGFPASAYLVVALVIIQSRS